MDGKVLLGRGKRLSVIPETTWKQHLYHSTAEISETLNFMTDVHHQVRYLVVEEIARQQKPIEPQFIARRLKLSLDQVNDLLDDLERKLFFLVRNNLGSVVWAYPMTVEATPHRLIFNSGERLYAA